MCDEIGIGIRAGCSRREQEEARSFRLLQLASKHGFTAFRATCNVRRSTFNVDIEHRQIELQL
jgi:hypothetical protein